MNRLTTLYSTSAPETGFRFQHRACHVSIASILALLATLAFANPALAVDVVDDPAQIDERVTQLVQATNSLSWEMYNYHRKQPEFDESYRAVKGIWEKSGQLQEALRTSTVETEVLNQRLTEISDSFLQVQKTLSGWQDGDRTTIVSNAEPVLRTVVSPGVGVDLPFVGIRVGSPDVIVTEQQQPQPLFQRKRLHVNSRGSQRSLEREIAAVNVAMSYLLEDAGIIEPLGAPATSDRSAPAPAPNPPQPDTALKTQPEVVAPRLKTSTENPKQK